jgi:methionyl-tRNA formyltransferase
MNIGFFGTPEISSYVLENLSKKHDIKWVVTQEDKKKGRGKKLLPTPVKEIALKLNLPVFQPEKLNKAFLENLTSVDVAIVIAYGKYIPSYLINFPKYSTLNIHLSLLPKYRGAAPVARAVLNGDDYTGVSIMKISKKMDAGDIIFQRKVKIKESDTRESLTWDLTKKGTNDLLNIIEDYVKGSIKLLKQNDMGIKVTYASKIEKKEGFIDWSNKAINIHNKVRAFYTWPGTKTSINGIDLKIIKTKLLKEKNENFNYGEIIEVNKNSGIFVKTDGKDVLLIEKVQVFGKKEMDVKDFLNGYEIKKGMRFS